MFGQGFNYGFISGGPPCFTDTTDIFKDNSGVALYTLDYDAKAAPILPFGTIVEGPSKVIDLDVSGYTSGTTISDKTSNNNNATIFGNVTYANGRFNLDGASDYLKINASTTFNSAANFTVEGWFKPDNITDLDHFFTIWDGGSNSKFYLRFNGTSGDLDGYIYTSSGGVYGNEDKYNPFPETHYGAFKLAVEGIARAYFNESLISSVGLRPFVIYGPGREIGGTAGVTLACKAAKQNLKYTVGFSGKAGFVYVEDVTNLVERLIDKSPVGALTINVNGITASVEDFLSIIKKNIPDAKVTLNGKPISVVEEILGGEPSKIFKDFKYTSLDHGINKTINFY